MFLIKLTVRSLCNNVKLKAFTLKFCFKEIHLFWFVDKYSKANVKYLIIIVNAVLFGITFKMQNCNFIITCVITNLNTCHISFNRNDIKVYFVYLKFIYIQYTFNTYLAYFKDNYKITYKVNYISELYIIMTYLSGSKHSKVELIAF